MTKPVKIIIKLVLVVTVAALIYILGILLINSIYDYRPLGGNYKVEAFQNYPQLNNGQTYSIISWNIGYGGLGRESDFFYDGGSMSRPDKKLYDYYWKGIDDRLKSFDTVDLILLQEVDLSSRRSYNIDQQDMIRSLFPSHASLFAINYNVQFVPLPLFNPMGGVVSGLQLLGKHKVLSACWQPFERDKSWPLGLFMPDRCYQVAEFGVENSRRLYLINTHNSAFDDGSQRDAQIERLYEEMRTAYNLGHYVIAGGDWNLNPEGWEGKRYISGDLPFLLQQKALESPGNSWQLVFDAGFPTNRDVSTPYIHGQTPCTTIDFFICSPNVLVREVKSLYNRFEFSDHQPVYLSFELIR